MGNSLHIELYCEGDILSCLDEAKKIAEIRGNLVRVEFHDGFNVCVWPDSKVTDLMTIYSLKKEIQVLRNGEEEGT